MASARRLSNSSNSLEEACLDKVNRLIRLCELPYPQLSSLHDINADVIIRLFERICGIATPDLIEEPSCLEDESHNVQSVIDSISLDILMISLSHITGEDIVFGNVTSIFNLLEILEAYLLYIPQEARAAALIPRNALLGASAHRETKAVSDICGVCGHERSSEQLLQQDSQASLEALSGSVYCPMCHFSFEQPDGSKAPHERVKTTFRRYRKKSLRKISPTHEIGSDDYEEGPLSSSYGKSEEDGSPSPGSDEIVPQPTVVEDGKLKPEFVRVGLRDVEKIDKTDSGPAREPLPSVPVQQEKSENVVPISADVEVLGDASTGSSPLLLPTVVLKEDPSKRKASVGNRSKSLNDILTSVQVPIRRDKVTQTSEGLLPMVSAESQEYHGARPKAKRVTEPEKDLAQLYGENFVKRITSYLEDRTHSKRHVAQIKKAYSQSLKRPRRKSISPICKKSFLLPYDLKRRSVSRTSPKKLHLWTPPRISPRLPKRKGISAKDTNLIREIIEEFPGVYLSPATLRRMTNRYERHLLNMRKNLKESLARKSQTQIQTEEAVKRQKILSDIFMKEIHHNQHERDVSEHKSLERQFKAKLRDRNLQSARQKQYCDEFYDQFKRRLQKRNYKEEQLLKNVFDDGLKMQKDQVNQLKQQLREKEEKDAKHNKIYIDALENYYQTQFSLLAKSLAVEKHDMDARAKAQQRVLDTMKRECRNKMEEEIRRMQDQIVRDSEDIHFREMAAENYRETLRDRFSAHPLKKI